MRLICGPSALSAEAGDLNAILRHLGSGIDRIGIELEELVRQREVAGERVALFVPYLGRALMEVSFTALLARLDPFRLLAVRRMQMSVDYDPSTLWRNAIRWQGDIVATRQKDMWTATVDPKDVSRALFGDYYDELVWRPAFSNLADAAPLNGDSRWLSELLLVSPDSFCARKREAVGQLFSHLSKAVHFEAVTPAISIDAVTAIELVQRVIREVAEAALVSHFVPHAFSCYGFDEAIAGFGAMENLRVMQ